MNYEVDQVIQFKKGQDYWFEEEGSGSSDAVANGALVVDAIFDMVEIPTSSSY